MCAAQCQLAGEHQVHPEGRGASVVKNKSRILIVDDHPLLRCGLAQLVSQQPDLEVCGEADGLVQALEKFNATQPDLVIIDMWLKDGHGLELIKEFRARKEPPKMLVVSMHEEPAYAERALLAGAHGYLAKSEVVDEIVEAIHQVLRGEVYLNRRTNTRLLHRMVGRAPNAPGLPEDLLSDRELQVFEALGNGLSSREIGEHLMLSMKTIETYREHIKQKLSLKSGNELIVRAVLWAHERR